MPYSERGLTSDFAGEITSYDPTTKLRFSMDGAKTIHRRTSQIIDPPSSEIPAALRLL